MKKILLLSLSLLILACTNMDTSTDESKEAQISRLLKEADKKKEETVEVEKANVGFMAIPITEGENHVVLKYRTPWLLPGILISGVTFVTYITVVIVLRVKRKHKLK